MTAVSDDLDRVVPHDWPPGLLQEAMSNLTPANHPSTHSLKTDSMAAFNLGVMAPHRATRDDGNLIPIYALGSRSPGGGYLNDPHLRATRIPGGTRAEINVFGCVALDRLLGHLREDGWGVPRPGSPRLDEVQRFSLKSLIEDKAREVEDGISNPGIKAIVSRLRGVLEISLSRSMNGDFPVYLDQRWKIEASTCPAPFPHWECGQFRIPFQDCRQIDLACLQRTLSNLGYNVEQAAYCLDPRYIDRRWQYETTIDVPCVKVVPDGGIPSDGEIDNDGLVSIDSAVGVTLGTARNEYFDHKETWRVPADGGLGSKEVVGSWYRYYGPNDPWRLDNHGSIKDSGHVGRWIHDFLIQGQAGPIPSRGTKSTWSLPAPQSAPVLRRPVGRPTKPNGENPR